MCLIFVSLHDHPVYKLIVAANRDEFYARRTAPADFWPGQPDILAGRDLEGGGTWMGITTTGRISMITNFRDPKNINPHAPSRGQLVSEFLQGNMSPAEYMKQVALAGKRYNGFNLIAGTPDELIYFSNYMEGVHQVLPGLHGLSNYLLDTPWPKVLRGKEMFKSMLNSPTVSVEDLFELLYDDVPADDLHLPNTGIGLERERALSPMFIKTPDYGSRCSTVILIGKDNHVVFSERVYDLKTFEHSTRNFELALPVSPSSRHDSF